MRENLGIFSSLISSSGLSLLLGVLFFKLGVLKFDDWDRKRTRGWVASSSVYIVLITLLKTHGKLEKQCNFHSFRGHAER